MTTSLLFNVIIVITLLLQVAAVIYALRLVRRTKYNVIWALCVIGFVLIACERYFELRSINSGGESYFYISIGLGLAVLSRDAVRPARIPRRDRFAQIAAPLLRHSV